MFKSSRLDYFYPRPPRGGRLANNAITAISNAQCLSTPSARRATLTWIGFAGMPPNFYPRPPRGGRHSFSKNQAVRPKFLSTPSARRATADQGDFLCVILISIHALREEGDAAATATTGHDRYFYPRPPRGGRPKADALLKLYDQFLSTPSARRATPDSWHRPSHRHYFYPRPPRGGRLAESWALVRPMSISIHALREEGDVGTAQSGEHLLDFYPRPPRGGRPEGFGHLEIFKGISIHALREEGDSGQVPSCVHHPISIHALREEGDDQGQNPSFTPLLISIHALREEGDPFSGLVRGRTRQFLSTPSARRATDIACGKPIMANISIHALREEGDRNA